LEINNFLNLQYINQLKILFMAIVDLIIKARIDEVTTIGQFTINSYKRDVDKFKAYKPTKYTDAFLTDLEAKKEVVKGIVNPVVLIAEQKKITERLLNTIIGLRDPMNLLEGYVADAVGLTVAPKDFGISPVRQKVNRGEVEGLNGALSTLVTNITNNKPALINVGYSDVAFTALKAAQTSIFDDNAAQNIKEGEIGALVTGNMGVINDFLKDIKGIWADGKRLFKISDKVKLKDYTLADIIRRIRQDELHTLIAGTVKSASNELASKVKVSARPSVVGKRGKSTTTDSKGYYELKGLEPKSYNITFTLPDGRMFVVSADAKTNEKVVVDFTVPAV
jgi:hypothetical protein